MPLSEKVVGAYRIEQDQSVRPNQIDTASTRF